MGLIQISALPIRRFRCWHRPSTVQFLSYFRDYEEAASRGDRAEGTRLFQPPLGLEITKVAIGEKLKSSGAFESSANAQDILVFCLSTAFSADLASEFRQTLVSKLASLFGSLVAYAPR